MKAFPNPIEGLKTEIMKNYSFIAGFVIFLALAIFQAFDIGKKNDRIRSLEFELRMLKLDKHTDSVIQYHVGEFRKKLGLPSQ